MKSVEQYMHGEREEGNSRCRLTVVLLDSGEFRARLYFGPGMESAHGDGRTVSDAIERLENELATGH